MSLEACVSATADELGIDEKDARDIADRVKSFRDKEVAAGRTDRVEERTRAFAKDRAEEAKIAAALKRKQAALNVLIRDTADKWLDGQVAKGVPLEEAVVSFLVGGRYARESVSARRVALEGDWVIGLHADLARKVPAAVELMRRKPAEAKPFFDDVVREWRELREGGSPGSTKNKDAQATAALLAEYAEAARIETNRAGANIGRLDGWGGPQHYDERRVLKAGEGRFVERVFQELDREKSFPGMSDNEVRESIAESFLSIVTGRDRAVSAREKGQRLGPSNIANSLGEHRVWHFKDADSWIRINDEFGRGNVVTGTLDHLHGMARKVSLMQRLGPNPEVMLQSVLEARARRLRTFAAGDPERAAAEIDKLRLGTGFGGTPIGKAWAVVSGSANVPTNVSRARRWAGVRVGLGMAKLGASLLSQFSDLATFGTAMHDQGRGVLQGQLDAVKGLLTGGGEGAHRRAMLMGVVGDSLTRDLHARFDAGDELTGKVARVQAAFYKLAGVHWWSDRLETAFANATSANMATEAAKGWEGVNPAMRHLLGLHGITPERWELVRQAVGEEGGARYVFPDKIGDMPDEAFHGLVADKMAEAEDALRERLGAQSVGRRQAAVTRQAGRVERARSAVEEATARLEAAYAAGDGRGIYNHGRSVEARQRALAAAQEAHRVASERLKGERPRAVRELTEAEQARLEEQRTRLVERERREVELSLRGFFADEAGYGVVKGDDRTRAVVTQGIPPGSPLGEVVRSVMQFKSFSIAFGQRVLGRQFLGGPGVDPSASLLTRLGQGTSSNIPAIATLIAFSTAYGYLSMTAKDALKNRSPKDPRSPATLLAAMVQGGGAGLYGDYLFGQYDRFGGNILQSAVGPTIGEVAGGVSLLQGLRQSAVHGISGAGDKGAGAADVMNYALNNAPFLNLLVLRTALDLAVLNQLQEWASPGTFQRRQGTVLKQFGQHYLLNPTLGSGHRPAGVSP